MSRDSFELTNRTECGRIAVEIACRKEMQDTLAILSFADDRELLDEFSQGSIKCIALEVEQFDIFFSDQLIKIIPGRRRRRRRAIRATVQEHHGNVPSSSIKTTSIFKAHESLPTDELAHFLGSPNSGHQRHA